MTVGERISVRRKELKMTMEELAEKIGKKAPVIYKYENDMIDMPSSAIKALHNVLGLSYFDLLDEDENEDRDLLEAYHNASFERQEDVRMLLRMPEKKKDTNVSAV